MKKSFFLVIASILVITTGCKHENPIKENIEDLEFSMQSPDKNSFVDSLDVRLIQFEETDESLIQSISQIQQYGNKLLISDNGQYKLLVFKITANTKVRLAREVKQVENT